MKNYDEVAESVFRRSKEVIKQNNKRRRTLIAIGSAASCLVIAGATGFGVWRNSVHGADMALSGGQFANDGRNHNVDSDTIIGFGVNSQPSSDDIIDSAGVFGFDTPGNVNGPGYATSSSEPTQELPEETSGSGGEIISTDPHNPDHTPEYYSIVNDYPEISSGTYDAPANGAVCFSDPLKGAMDEFTSTSEKDIFLFNVFVDFYKNGEHVDIDSSELREGEWNRLCENGFKCEYEECHRLPSFHHCRMLLTHEQLDNFDSSDSYGYLIRLSGECRGSSVIDKSNHHFITRIDGYKYEYGEYPAPENGKIIYSNPLHDSMEEYGYKDEEGYDIIYNVTVGFFSNGEPVDVSIPDIREDEWDRMVDLGYQCGFATSSKNWGEIVEYEFHVNFTKEQLENFVPDERYGYIFSLHGEHVEGMEEFDDYFDNFAPGFCESAAV